RIWTVGAVAGRRRIDQGRLAPMQVVVTEAELVHDAGAEILGDHIGAVDELERDLSALGCLQVERDAALVAVGARMHHSLSVVPEIAAAPVALPGPVRRLDGNHVGAEVRQRLDAHGAEQEMIEADDADSLQQIEHRIPREPFDTPHGLARAQADHDGTGTQLPLTRLPGIIEEMKVVGGNGGLDLGTRCKGQIRIDPRDPDLAVSEPKREELLVAELLGDHDGTLEDDLIFVHGWPQPNMLGAHADANRSSDARTQIGKPPGRKPELQSLAR